MARKITIELNIPGSFKGEPIFYYMVKNYDVIPNIIEASFSTDMGWAIVEIQGEDEEVKSLIGFLESKGVEVKAR
jgi:ABC-type methionine transport system ATPase subunit